MSDSNEALKLPSFNYTDGSQTTVYAATALAHNRKSVFVYSWVTTL